MNKCVTVTVLVFLCFLLPKIILGSYDFGFSEHVMADEGRNFFRNFLQIENINLQEYEKNQSCWIGVNNKPFVDTSFDKFIKHLTGQEHINDFLHSVASISITIRPSRDTIKMCCVSRLENSIHKLYVQVSVIPVSPLSEG